MDTTEIIYSAGHIEEAYLVRELLADAGIDAVIENEALQGAVGELPFGPATSPRLRVATENAAKARDVVRMFEHQQRMKRGQPEPAAPPPAGSPTDWPECPDCGRRRQTICPVCRTAGEDFPSADLNIRATDALAAPGDEQPPPAHLICTTCDEPFVPQYYRRCVWCGRDFADGVAAAEKVIPSEPVTPAMWVALGGLLAVAAALVGYFWWITRA
ncbi:MAG: DUF2007 domain-containing protein [Planctomycetales bacterium]|nr:DUF2007 domain-containing protein [Planctomycetales bacterium]